MARSGVIVLSFAVLLAVLDLGACLKCYQCNSQSDPKCADTFKGGNLVDCANSEQYNRNYLSNLLSPTIISQTNVQGATKYCHKLITDTKVVVRTCLDANPLNINQTCQMLTSMNPIDKIAKFTHCSACDKDSCNGVGAISASLPLAALTVLISYLVFKQ